MLEVAGDLCRAPAKFENPVGVSEYRRYKAQAQESLLNSGATNEAVFILGR